MKRILRQVIPYILGLIAVAFISAQGIQAQSASVTATVTAQNVALSVSDGTVAYGTITLSNSEDTTTSGLNDSQTITNDGNVTEDFNINGQNSGTWTLSASSGADNYVHEFCTTDCDSSPTWTPMTTGDSTLATDIAAASTKVFDLKITLPSSSSSYTQQSVDVTVTAVAS